MFLAETSFRHWRLFLCAGKAAHLTLAAAALVALRPRACQIRGITPQQKMCINYNKITTAIQNALGNIRALSRKNGTCLPLTSFRRAFAYVAQGTRSRAEPGCAFPIAPPVNVLRRTRRKPSTSEALHQMSLSDNLRRLARERVPTNSACLAELLG